MNSLPLFSIIIPVHNRANLLRKCLESLNLQTFKNFEAIVVDDASSEDIKSIVEFYSSKLNLIYIRNNISMKGPARPRNIAIEKSQGSWLAFLDSDDWWYSNKLERIYANLDKGDIIYHELDICNGEGKHLGKTSSRQLKNPAKLDLLVNANALTNSSVVAKKELVLKAGGLDESQDLIAVEDYDLWLQLANYTERFYFLNEFLGGYYVGEGNISKSSEVQIKRLEYVFSKNMKDFEGLDRKKILSALAYCKAVCYFQMKEFKKAKDEYLYVLKNNSSIIMKMKSVARVLYLMFKL